MIGKLTGRVDSFGEDFVILDVGGVGYVVHCASRALRKLPSVGDVASLAIETQVREDAIRLFGFTSDVEREWFRLLQTVQGVGSKVALAILSALDPSGLATAIAAQDRTMIATAPGVGPKLAARIAAELKDKTPVSAIGLEPALSTGAPDAPAATKALDDAVSALVNLGYGRPQAIAAIAASARALGDQAETPALIRRGLRELAQ